MNDSTKCSVAKILPVPNKMSTLGTTVILNNGAELAGVTSIHIVAETNDAWRATITLDVFLSNVPEIEVKTHD